MTNTLKLSTMNTITNTILPILLGSIFTYFIGSIIRLIIAVTIDKY